MKRFNKIYLEISNICNVSCAFCPGTTRKKKAMTQEEFAFLLPKLRPFHAPGQAGLQVFRLQQFLFHAARTGGIELN